MKKTIYIIVMVLLGAVSCVKEVAYDNPLSLSAERNNLSAAEGSTPVLVFANGPWKAFLPSDCKWARLEKTEGSGLGEFIFNYDENPGGARKVTVTVVSKEKSVYIDMVQNSSSGTLNIIFPYSSVTVSAVSGLAEVPFETNIQQEEISRMKVSVKSSEGAEIDWVNNLTLFPDHLRFNMGANTTGATRSAVISIDYTDVYGNTLSRRLTVKQGTAKPNLSFDASVMGVMFICKPATVKLPFTTNLQLFVPQLLSSAESSASWAQIAPNYGATQEIVVNVEENSGPARIARITMKYTDSEGVETPFEYLLVQKARVENMGIEQLKALISGESGSITINKEGLLEAVAISDCTNANIETNPNTSTVDIDYTMNWRTAYVTNESGTSGLRMVFDDRADNTLMRGDRLYIDIAGLTLIKEANPQRYTLKGIKSQHISKAEEKAEVTAREKTLGELVDDDVYTLVKLKGLEFTFKSGAYTNCHEGYYRQLRSPYVNPLGNAINYQGATDYKCFSDCTPCSLRDAAGRDINALINNETPWRRYGNGVPQGTCDITGIITHTDLLRWAYKGYLGRYQLRILEESDIEQTGSAFSRTVIAWNWGPKNTSLSTEAVKRPTSPENPAFYSITSNLEGLSDFKFNVNSLPDYNNVINYNKDDSDNNKGLVQGGSVVWTKSGKFWASGDTSDMSAAPWICFGFSTAGLSGTNLVFNWTACQGAARAVADNIYAPALWKVEYSTDGASFTAVEGIWAIHPQGWYKSTCSLYAVTGNHMYTTPLPASLLGQDRVYVRIRAASAKAMTNDFESEDGGELRESDNMLRLGEVAIEYN